MNDAIGLMFKHLMTRLSEEGFDVPTRLSMELMEEAMALGFQSIESRTDNS